MKHFQTLLIPLPATAICISNLPSIIYPQLLAISVLHLTLTTNLTILFEPPMLTVATHKNQRQRITLPSITLKENSLIHTAILALNILTPR